MAFCSPVALGNKYSPVSLKAAIPDPFAVAGRKAAAGNAYDKPSIILPVSPSRYPCAAVPAPSAR